METSARTMSNVREVFELVGMRAGGRAGGRAGAGVQLGSWTLHSPMQLATTVPPGSRVVCGSGVAAYVYAARCPRLAWRAHAVACACALRCSLLMIVAAVCAAQAVVEAMASRQRKQRAVAKDKPCCAVV